MTGPLAGFVVGVTADRRAEEQITLLEQSGATCVAGPVIRTQALGPPEALHAATLAVVEHPPEVVILTTGIGVRGWLEAAEAMGLAERLRASLAGAAVLARGPKTTGAALAGGIEVTWSAATATTAEIADYLGNEIAGRPALRGRRVAVQLDGSLDDSLTAKITALGAEVVKVPVYRWTMPDDLAPGTRLIRAVAESNVDAVTFTARPAVENFAALARSLDLAEPVMAAFAGGVVPVCIGPVCAAAAEEAGFGAPFQPDRPRLGAMVRQLGAWFATRRRTLSLAGMTVDIQGRRVTVADRGPVHLSDRERRVLEVLAERPGVVHSKRALLGSVWNSHDADDHVVEVTVARLRQRLGPAGVGIETVVRRGYRLSAT